MERNIPLCNEELIRRNIERIRDIQGIDSHIMTQEACREIEDILDLDSLTTEKQLRGTRNAVVMILSDMMKAEGGFTKDGWSDYDAMQLWQSRISAIVCIIDNRLWGMGFEI